MFDLYDGTHHFYNVSSKDALDIFKRYLSLIRLALSDIDNDDYLSDGGIDDTKATLLKQEKTVIRLIRRVSGSPVSTRWKFDQDRDCRYCLRKLSAFDLELREQGTRKKSLGV